MQCYILDVIATVRKRLVRQSRDPDVTASPLNTTAPVSSELPNAFIACPQRRVQLAARYTSYFDDKRRENERMDSELPDYYAILNVGPKATQKEIRDAYRKESLKTHPDRLPQGASAEERKKATEQFQVRQFLIDF